MDEHQLPPAGDETPSIADAESLFGDDPEPGRRPKPSLDFPITADGGYEIEDLPEPQETDRPEPRTGPEATRSRATSSSSPASPARQPSEAVEEVWTRNAEWGGTVLVLVGASLMLMALLYVLLAFEEFGLAFCVLVAGGLAVAALSYPILITLERPVRVTPEQAVSDYFAALSHHFPHYRRMWLLLSTAGRSAGGFATFEGFRYYWKARLTELRGAQSSALTPLKFVVAHFKAETSAGKSEISVSFTVRVLVRGRQTDGAVESIPVKTSLVKGPDRMWYLDRGTLP